jgi:hypothetical protein
MRGKLDYSPVRGLVFFLQSVALPEIGQRLPNARPCLFDDEPRFRGVKERLIREEAHRQNLTFILQTHNAAFVPPE